MNNNEHTTNNEESPEEKCVTGTFSIFEYVKLEIRKEKLKADEERKNKPILVPEDFLGKNRR